MTPTNQKPALSLRRNQSIAGNFVQSLMEKNPEKFGAAISTAFATIFMTAFLWSQIVSSVVLQTV